MYDESKRDELIGGCIHVVEYSIVFTKREFETVLHASEVTVEEECSGQSFANRQVAQFFGETASGGELATAALRRLEANRYQDLEKLPSGGWRFPTEDEKYVHCDFRVIRAVRKTLPFGEPHRQDALRRIRDVIQ